MILWGAMILPTTHIFVAIRSMSQGHSMKLRPPRLLETSLPTCQNNTPTHAVPQRLMTYTTCVLLPVPLEEVAVSYSSNHALSMLSTLLSIKLTIFLPASFKRRENHALSSIFSILMKDKSPSPVLHKIC